MVKMFVYKVALDVTRSQGWVLLADEAVGRILPIAIGIFEARAIAAEMQGDKPPRPMTHDLLAKVVEELDYDVRRVDITELNDGIYYALITLAQENGRQTEIDARPSDSIALALRAEAPIYVDEDVLAEGELRPENLAEAEAENSEAEMEAFRQLMTKVSLREGPEAESEEEGEDTPQ